MNDFPSRPGRSGPRTRPPAGSRLVRLCIALSGRYPHALLDIEQRLGSLLRPSGITSWVTERRLTLIRPGRVITPAEWSRVIGWLLLQPEVVFVAREYPRSPHGQAR